MIEPFKAGRALGEEEARKAWTSGTTWGRSPAIWLPADHRERKEFLAGYATGFALYNSSIDTGRDESTWTETFDTRLKNGTAWTEGFTEAEVNRK